MLAILAGLPFLVFCRSFGIGLIGWDDTDYFAGNPSLHNGALAGLGELWTRAFLHDYAPITQLTIWLDLCLSHGASFVVSRVQQLAWLGLGTVAVFQLARRVSGRDGLAWVVALLYCLHPVTAESALWLGERKNLVASALTWWSIERHVAWRQGAGRGALWASILLCPLALLAKVHAVIIPAVITVYEAVLGTSGWRNRALAILPTGLTSIAFTVTSLLLLHLYDAHSDHLLGGSLAAAVLCDGAILARYLSHTVLPYHLALFYRVIEDPGRWTVLLGWWMLLIGVVAGTIALARERRLLVFAWLAAAVSLLPAINLKATPVPMSDHYLHWALPWLLLILCQMAVELLQKARMPAWERPAGLVAAGSALFFALLSNARVAEFSSYEAVAVTAIRHQPDCAIGWATYCDYQLTKSSPDLGEAGRAGLIALRCADWSRIFYQPYVSCVIAGTLECQRREGGQSADQLLARTLPPMLEGYQYFTRGMIQLLENHNPEAVAALTPLYPPWLQAVARTLRGRCRSGELQPWDIPPVVDVTESFTDLYTARNCVDFGCKALAALANADLLSGDRESAFDISCLLVNLRPTDAISVRIYREACRQLGLEHALQRIDREMPATR